MTHGKHVSGGDLNKQVLRQHRICWSLSSHHSRLARYTVTTRQGLHPDLASKDRPLLPVCCHKRGVFSQWGHNFLFCIYCNKKFEGEDV